MSYIGTILSLIFVIITARLLLKKYNPHAVLLISGLLMLIVAQVLNYNLPSLKEPTGFSGFDLFRYIKESFSKTNAGVGLMIMTIGGFVAYIDKIGASDALVHVAMKPLKLLKKKTLFSSFNGNSYWSNFIYCYSICSWFKLIINGVSFPNIS